MTASPNESSDDYVRNLRKRQGYMPVGDHLEELRWRLIRSVIWIAVFSIAAFVFFDRVWEFVMQPIVPLIDQAASQNRVVKIINTELQHNFIVYFKTTIMVGAMLAVPVILFEAWGFILPALDRAFRRVGNGLLLAAVILFWGGAGFARFYIWPMVTRFLTEEWTLPAIEIPAAEGVRLVQPELHLTINKYLSFFFGFHFAFGLAFELPIISVLLALMGILRSSFFWRSWRIAIVAIAVMSALVTPPDAFSMLAMMLPLIVLYFFSGLLVYAIESRQTPADE